MQRKQESAMEAIVNPLSHSAKVSFTINSKTAAAENNMLTIRGWKFNTEHDSTKTNFSTHAYILLASRHINILFTLEKTPGGIYSFDVQKNDLSKVPARDSLFTYSYYTLNPKELNVKFDVMQIRRNVDLPKDLNAERYMLTLVWEFLEACGMNKLAYVRLDNSARFFSDIKLDVPPAGRHVSSECLNSLEQFGKDKCGIMYYPFTGLLSTAKAKEHETIQLTVPGETKLSTCNVL